MIRAGALPANPAHPRRRAGFTFVGFLVGIFALSLAAGILIPQLQLRRAGVLAAEVVSDLRTLRDAATDYVVEHGYWPPDGRTGEVPPELAPYLPAGFSFSRERYELKWENWAFPHGLPRSPDTVFLTGVSVTIDDARVGYAASRMLGSSVTTYDLSDRYTFIFEGF